MMFHWHSLPGWQTPMMKLAPLFPKKAKNFKLSARNIISIVTYTLAACLGGFCPIAAYIIVAAVSAWWIFPERKK